MIKKQYFKQPGEGLRHLKNVMAIAGGVTAVGLQLSGLANMSTGVTLAGSGTFVGNRNAMDQGTGHIRKGARQHINLALI